MTTITAMKWRTTTTTGGIELPLKCHRTMLCSQAGLRGMVEDAREQGRAGRIEWGVGREIGTPTGNNGDASYAILIMDVRLNLSANAPSIVAVRPPGPPLPPASCPTNIRQPRVIQPAYAAQIHASPIVRVGDRERVFCLSPRCCGHRPPPPHPDIRHFCPILLPTAPKFSQWPHHPCC